MEKDDNGTYLDLRKLVKLLKRKLGVLALAVALGAAIDLFIATCVVEPTYRASVCLYVNNGSFDANSHITSSDIAASRELVDTCCAILNTRTVLEEVIEKAALSCTTDKLAKSIESGAVGQTEVMRLSVEANDPQEAARIANCIAEVLPNAVAAVIPNASLYAIDSAVPDRQKVAPSVVGYTVLGACGGGFAVVAYLSLSSIYVAQGSAERMEESKKEESIT